MGAPVCGVCGAELEPPRTKWCGPDCAREGRNARRRAGAVRAERDAARIAAGKAAVLDALVEAPFWASAAEAAGVDGETVRRWRRDDPEFSAAAGAARAAGRAEWEDRMLGMIAREALSASPDLAVVRARALYLQRVEASEEGARRRRQAAGRGPRRVDHSGFEAWAAALR